MPATSTCHSLCTAPLRGASPDALILLGALIVALIGACGGPAATDDPADAALGGDLGGDLDGGDAHDAPQDVAEGVDAADADDLVEGGDAEIEDAEVDAIEVDAEVDPIPPGPWRSALYPEGWAPGLRDEAGRGLQDYSFAGYRNGEVEPGAQEGAPVLDVGAFGADPSGQVDARAAIQAALDEAGRLGGAVVLVPAGLYRIDGVLTISASGVVLRGEGAERSRLSFTTFEGMAGRGHLTLRGALEEGPELALVADAEAGASEIEVAPEALGALAVGDDVAVGWVITEAFVEAHRMAGVWRAFNGTWQPFFRRQVVAIDRLASPPRVALDVPLRYPALVRDLASVRVERGAVREVGVEDLGLSNAVAWDAAWDQDQVAVLELDGVADGWVRRVASFPSPAAPAEGDGAGAHLQSSGVRVVRSKRVTVADCRMELPQNRGGGGNGYLFELRQSGEVLFRDCVARAGRHNFIQNWGFGATGCVWLRVHSSEGEAWVGRRGPHTIGRSELHHSLAMANLVDDSRFDDGWDAVNRKAESSGAGHTGTENVMWRVWGVGKLRSFQFGHGYVIGTDPALDVFTTPIPGPEGAEEAWDALSPWSGAAPDDWLEGPGRADDLRPASLYEDQRARRLGR